MNTKDKNPFSIPKPDQIERLITLVEETPSKLAIWDDTRIWKLTNEDCYSARFQEIISTLRPMVIKFVHEGYNSTNEIRLDYPIDFLRKFAYNLAKLENIEEALLITNDWRGELGLEFAKGQLKIFEKSHGRLPTSKDKEMTKIMGAIIIKKWQSFNVRSWNDLMAQTFNQVNQEIGKYQGKEGLERAKKEFSEFNKNHKRPPTTKDKEIWSILRAINRREWATEGIVYWSDLKNVVFGDKGKKTNYYLGKQGLDRAITDMRAFKEKHNRYPTSKDNELAGIRQAIKRGEWKPWDITSWNALMVMIFGEVNLEYGKYEGKAGLSKAMDEIRLFREKNDRYPKRKDKEMGCILYALDKGKWTKYGIRSWNKLLIRIFGDVNKKS